MGNSKVLRKPHFTQKMYEAIDEYATAGENSKSAKVMDMNEK